jgi:exopolysaccharide biosynthesis protein
MRSLGVVEAINLDGGGSSVMVIDGELSGVPSDKSGERPVGDAILVFDAKPEASEKVIVP